MKEDLLTKELTNGLFHRISLYPSYLYSILQKPQQSEMI